MRIPLDRGAGRSGKVPLSRQIQLHFERLITQGLMAPGVKLPATRDLARELGINRTTVALAYDELVAGGATGGAAAGLDRSPLQGRPGDRGRQPPSPRLHAGAEAGARRDLVRG